MSGLGADAGEKAASIVVAGVTATVGQLQAAEKDAVLNAADAVGEICGNVQMLTGVVRDESAAWRAQAQQLNDSLTKLTGLVEKLLQGGLQVKLGGQS